MKKVSLYILFIICGFIICDKVFAMQANDIININGIKIEEDEYQRLQNIGFTDDEIYHMDYEEYCRNKDLLGQVVASETKYIKTVTFTSNGYETQNLLNEPLILESYLTKEEFYKQYNAYLKKKQNINTEDSPMFASATQEDYKLLTLSLIEVGSTYRIKNNLKWLEAPTVRMKDKIGYEISNNVYFNNDTRFGKQTWKLCNGNDCFTGYQNYDENSTSWLSDVGYNKRALEPNLKNDEWKGIKKYSVKELSIYIYSDLSKEPELSVTTIQAYGTYEHQILTGGYKVMTPTFLEVNVNWK